MVEVLDMRVSKELATDFHVEGMTPLPEMSRAFNGGVKANRKLASYKVSIPSLIEASRWKQRFRVIMIFNIATYRRGVTSHTVQPVEWTEGGRLSTQIKSYFPAGQKIYYKAKDRPWTDDEDEDAINPLAKGSFHLWAIEMTKF
eukprot:g19846.t1